MSPGEVFVAGTGSFAAEIADWARTSGLAVLGLIELLDHARIGTVRHGLPVVGAESPQPGAHAVLGAGGNRRESWNLLEAQGWIPLTLVHPTACLAADVRLGPGVTVGPMAVIGAATTIGDQAIISRGVLIGHHAQIGAFATLNPGVNIGGNTRVGTETFAGMGAKVVDGVGIGERAVIGAGALVLRDVDAATRVQGVPARAVATQVA